MAFLCCILPMTGSLGTYTFPLGLAASRHYSYPLFSPQILGPIEIWTFTWLSTSIVIIIHKKILGQLCLICNRVIIWLESPLMFQAKFFRILSVDWVQNLKILIFFLDPINFKKLSVIVMTVGNRIGDSSSNLD